VEVASISAGLQTSKQDVLVSGTNIKTINGQSILGSGNINISGGGGGGSVPSTFGVIIDGGSSVPTTGSLGYWTAPGNGTINGWDIFSDVSGSAVVDVRKSTYAGFPTTSSIAGSEKPTLSSQQKNQDYSLSTWTSSMVAGDVFEFVLESASTVKRINVIVKYTKE
jgi:hypothetical protein